MVKIACFDPRYKGNGDSVKKIYLGEITQPRNPPVSLNPLKLGQAITGLFAIPNPDATKPKRKKAPPPAKE